MVAHDGPWWQPTGHAGILSPAAATALAQFEPLSHVTHRSGFNIQPGISMSQYPPNYSGNPNDPNNPYGQQPYAQPPYGQPPYGQPYGGQAPYQPYGLGYGGPARPQRPASVTVLAVIGIIWGSLMTLGNLCGVIVLASNFTPAGNNSMSSLQNDPTMHVWNIVSGVAGLILGIVLLYGSINALSLKPQARLAMIWYSVPQILLSVVGVVVALVIGLPHLNEILNSPNARTPGFKEGALGGFWGSIMFQIVVVIYAILILLYMNRPHVKAAFGVGAAPGGPAGPGAYPPGGPYQS
jgi:hypothetical protein